MLACLGREAMVMAPPPMHDSAVSPCFHGCPAFLHRHFPPWSPPSHPLSPSLHNQQKPPPWDCSTIPKLQLPASAPSLGPTSLSGCSKGCLTLIPFRLPQISCFTLSLKCFSFDSDNCPDVGMDPCFSSATHWGQVQSYQHSCIPPSSFILPSFAWFCIFFSSGLGLLSALSWCSACTSVSERVFLMYPWREMSTYYSSILFSLEFFFLTQEKSQESWDHGNPHWNMRPCISSFWHPHLPLGMNMGFIELWLLFASMPISAQGNTDFSHSYFLFL